MACWRLPHWHSQPHRKMAPARPMLLLLWMECAHPRVLMLRVSLQLSEQAAVWVNLQRLGMFNCIAAVIPCRPA